MLLALAMLGCLTPMRAQATELNYSDTIAASRNFITELMAEQNIPGCTIVVVDGQDVVCAEGFGYSDKELKLPVTPTTVMPIGSVSKLLTALMVLQGVDEGALELETSITNYLPDFSMQPRFEDQADGWTLRTLLDHHSGIPGDIYNGAFVTGDYWAGYNPWLIDYFLADYPLYPPRLLAS
jgi:CubicO group peptidase (beta-lactamase class C family)